jgi:hypothetical protein
MGSSANAALPWTLLSAGLCAQHARTLGLSIFLLVPICVGDCDVRASGNRVPQIENLNADDWQGMSFMLPLPPT